MFSQIKDIKHIERDFRSVSWIQNLYFLEHDHVAYQIEGDTTLKLYVEMFQKLFSSLSLRGWGFAMARYRLPLPVRPVMSVFHLGTKENYNMLS